MIWRFSDQTNGTTCATTVEITIDGEEHITCDGDYIICSTYSDDPPIEIPKPIYDNHQPLFEKGGFVPKMRPQVKGHCRRFSNRFLNRQGAVNYRHMSGYREVERG